ncbi:MAG: DUF3438 family protein [Alteromonadaceae bacterium]|nr:DUF3438 family protein [Alteromonadaceae bacterium]
MIKCVVIVSLTLFFTCFSTLALSVERVTWQQGVEIKTELLLKDERKVIFPEQVRLSVKSHYKAIFTYSLIDTVLFLTAKASFNEKLTLQGLNSGRFYMLEVSVSGESVNALDDLIIHIVEKKPEDNEAATAYQPVIVDPIDLVQYVSQTLYAPSTKLIEPLPGIKTVNVKQRSIPSLYRGGSLEAEVLGGWYGGQYYITAVKFNNVTPHKIPFEPCRVRGDFYAVSAQFNSVFARDHKADFTVAYLLSLKPFDVAIQSRKLSCV